MAIIAWILLGLSSGVLARQLLPGRKAQGLVLPCMTGVLGALAGGWSAASLLTVPHQDAFFSIPAWLAALAGAAILLLACRPLTGRPRAPGRGSRGVPVTVPVRPRDAFR